MVERHGTTHLPAARSHVGTRRDVVNLDGGAAVDFLHI